jgi:signal transduction histidine kinase
MAMPAGFVFLALAVGVLCARADRGIMAILRSQTPGGTMMRRWMFMPVLLLLAMGVMHLVMGRGTIVDPGINSWALFMTSLVVLTAAVWATASVLYRAGLERDQAHRTLEERVKERTADLNRANEALSAAKEELAQANFDLEKMVEERTRHLKETIRSLETVCYNIAHDLRAPNRAIAGFAEALLAQHGAGLDPTAQDCLSRIGAAAQRSDALTLDLLAYGRLGHAELPCTKESLSFHVNQVISNLGADISATGAAIEVSEPLPWVWANPAALQQVLANLVTNAMKFVGEGVKPRVRIRAETAGNYTRLMVEDNGIGIPQEYRQGIFGVFERLDAAQKYPGSGIGLAIVQKSVERMGGRVGVESGKEQGSCFWFELRTA